MRRAISWLPALALTSVCAFGLAGCEDEGPTDPPQVLSVTIEPSEISMESGEQVHVSAEVETTGGASSRLTWSARDTSVVTMSGTGQGRRVTGQAPGSTVVTGTSVLDPTRSDSVEVTVVHGVP